MTFKKSNSFVSFDFEKFVLLVTVTDKIPSEEEWKETKTIMKSFYESAEIGNFRFSIIFDLKQLGSLPYKYFEEWSSLFIDYKEKTEKYIHRTSIIVDSLLIRTAINLFFKIYTTVRPMKFLDSIDEGRTFILEDFDSKPIEKHIK